MHSVDSSRPQALSDGPTPRLRLGGIDRGPGGKSGPRTQSGPSRGPSGSEEPEAGGTW